MAPSITETLFALGLGSRVVGVTRHCHYPPEVEEIKARPSGNVGGYFDPNLEAITALQPDLVIFLEEQAKALPNFDALKLETLVVSHQTINGIIESFRQIGMRCGAGQRGRWMAEDYRRRAESIRRRAAGLARPKTLVVVERTLGRGQLADLRVVANDDYFDTILEWAGGQNACARRGIRYPVLSTEGVLTLNPDVIVDLIAPDLVRQYGLKAWKQAHPGAQVDEIAPETLLRYGREKLTEDWNGLEGVEAVKRRRVFVLDQDYAFVPGPRFLRLIEELARLLHPEVDWSLGDDSLPHNFSE